MWGDDLISRIRTDGTQGARFGDGFSLFGKPETHGTTNKNTQIDRFSATSALDREVRPAHGERSRAAGEARRVVWLLSARDAGRMRAARHGRDGFDRAAAGARVPDRDRRTSKIRTAIFDYDCDQEDEVDRYRAMLETQPGAAVVGLKRSALGVRFLIEPLGAALAAHPRRRNAVRQRSQRGHQLPGCQGHRARGPVPLGRGVPDMALLLDVPARAQGRAVHRHGQRALDAGGADGPEARALAG